MAMRISLNQSHSIHAKKQFYNISGFLFSCNWKCSVTFRWSDDSKAGLQVALTCPQSLVFVSLSLTRPFTWNPFGFLLPISDTFLRCDRPLLSLWIWLFLSICLFFFFFSIQSKRAFHVTVSSSHLTFHHQTALTPWLSLFCLSEHYR